jgi:predicted chitinase
MQPVCEIGKGRNRPYGVPDPQTGRIYYGRGLVQLTWKLNYEKFAKITGLDLAGDPDLALQPVAAVQILFDGMVQGLFTGKKLDDFLASPEPDFLHARRIVNGMDKAAEIAGFARLFEAALVATPQAASTAPVRPGWLSRIKTRLGY